MDAEPDVFYEEIAPILQLALPFARMAVRAGCSGSNCASVRPSAPPARPPRRWMAIAWTWRTATPTQRTVLLASRTTSHRFVEDWIAGRLPVEEDGGRDEMRRPSPGEPDA